MGWRITSKLESELMKLDLVDDNKPNINHDANFPLECIDTFSEVKTVNL